MNQPVFSIILPCYNAAPYIGKCVESIMAQTFSVFECIAIDDASPDSTPEILDRMAEKYPSLHVIHLPENRGVSHARNQGLDIASGQWILFVDGDDFLPENALALFAEQVKTYPNASLICGNLLRVTADGTQQLSPLFKNGKWRLLSVDSMQNRLEDGGRHFNNSCGKVFRRDLLGNHRFREDLHYGEDTLFTHEFVFLQQKPVVITEEEIVYCYRQIPSSCVHTASMEQRLENLKKMILALNELSRKCGIPGLARQKAAEYLWCIYKFGQDCKEKIQVVRQLMDSDFYREELCEHLHQCSKWRQKLVIYLLEHHIFSAILLW